MSGSQMNHNAILEASGQWQQGQLVEVEIVDLNDAGEGVGKFEGRAVFVPDTVTGDRILARLVRVKPNYAHGQIYELLVPSPHRVRPSCIVADKCGGCQWQHVDYQYQLAAKQNLVAQALERIGGIKQPPVAPIIASPDSLGYRNKSTYPLGFSSAGQVQAGYYRRGSHQLVNLNQCPVQDASLNPLLAEVKRDIEEQRWSIYDEQKHRGLVRHLSLRVGRRTGEMLLTLVVTKWPLPKMEEQAQEWLRRYPKLVGVSLNLNPAKTNAIFGDRTRCIAGKPYLQEEFAGLQLQLRPDTFFQVNAEAAEALLQAIIAQLNLQGTEVLADAYCGIGTFTLPLAKLVSKAIGIEVQRQAVDQAEENACLNQIKNVEFRVGAVEEILPQLEVQPDIVLLDPPRQGCDRAVLDCLLQMQPQRIVMVSCKPATLARDLKILLADGTYRLVLAQAADFFPQTAHVECAAFLERA